MLLCVILLVNVWFSVIYAECPAYFTPSGSKCYQAYTDTKSWADAVAYCKIGGGTLAKIDSEDDQSIITDIIEATQDGTKTINLTTGNDYKYHYMHDQGLDITGQTSIVFQVMNCNDAHVALSQTKGDDAHNTYEIVLGGWGNTQSVIRDCKQCHNFATAHTNHFDSCQTYRTFWISWANGVIKVGRESLVGHNMFMSWRDPTPHPVNYIAFATGWGAVGKWKFEIGSVLPGLFWIGGTNSGSSTNWHWSPSNTNFGFTNWAVNKPFNGAASHCVLADSNNYGLWSNDDCNAKMNYVCQVPSFNG